MSEWPIVWPTSRSTTWAPPRPNGSCFERTFKVVRQALEVAESDGGSGWSRAVSATRVLVRFQLSEEEPLLRLSSTSALPDQADRARVHKTLQQLTERMGSVLVDGLMDGSVRALDTSIAAQMVMGLVNGAANCTAGCRK